MPTQSREMTGPLVSGAAETPIAGAIAGILFAVLFTWSISIMILVGAGGGTTTGEWLADGAGQLRFAVSLLPFAGIFFLWFIAVARERLGRFEDQFFSTVFLGSGLLFLVLMFAAATSLTAIAAAYELRPDEFAASGTYVYARSLVAVVFNVYALRMAAVFMISQATLWLRTGVMPRWLAFLSYAVALVLLFVVTELMWVVLVFPGWVLVVSLYIIMRVLVLDRSERAPEAMS